MDAEEVLSRINQAALEEASELDLSGLGLRSLPPQVWNLTNLTFLNLEHNELTALPPEIGYLTNLSVDMKFTANAVLSKIRDSLGIPLEGLDDYCQSPKCQNSKVSRAFIRKTLKAVSGDQSTLVISKMASDTNDAGYNIIAK